MSANAPARGPRRLLLAALALVAALCALPLLTGCAAAHGPAHRAGCGSYPAQRDPSNPLDLTRAPGANPLTGASFFVPGPAKGSAAGAIARLLGVDPATLPVTESWDSFARQLRSGPLHDKLAADPVLAHKVAMLSKIASQPEAQRISSYSWGGTPSGIYRQTHKVVCENTAADPGTVPIINTYFLHPDLGGCPTPAQVRDDMPVFRRRVDAMAAATGHHPAVFLLEVDGLGSSACVTRMGAIDEWEAALRYEMGAVQALPHTVVYVEAGYSDSNSVAYTARILRSIGVGSIRGFFTNDTHMNWTIDEDQWATAVARRIPGGTHFIVNTADNGRGPLRNAHPARDGVEDLCNPPGRGIGIRDTTDTAPWDMADAYLWEHPPGNSSGCGGGPPGGVFWPARAVDEAANANDQLGPGLPSDPY